LRKINLSNFQVATSETARDINRRIILNLIRTHQPISRAELSRYSGLQRSTVSTITEQLIAIALTISDRATCLLANPPVTIYHRHRDERC